MSSLLLFMKSGFAQAPLANGIGRFVPQCQRMTLKFCLNHGGSRGVREFIQHDLVEYARMHPSLVIYLKPRRHRSPVLVAEYLNGGREWMSFHQMQRDEIYKWIEIHRTASGYGDMHYRSYISTQKPSIQGPWTPFTHKPLDRNIIDYPQESLNIPPNLKPSTTEIIEKMFGEEAQTNLQQRS